MILLNMKYLNHCTHGFTNAVLANLQFQEGVIKKVTQKHPIPAIIIEVGILVEHPPKMNTYIMVLVIMIIHVYLYNNCICLYTAIIVLEMIQYSTDSDALVGQKQHIHGPPVAPSSGTPMHFYLGNHWRSVPIAAGLSRS